MSDTVRLIAEHFAQLPRVRAAILVGSQARADPQAADWDIWVLCRQPRPRDETVDALWSGHLCPALLRGLYVRSGRFRVNNVLVKCDLWEIEKVQRRIDQVVVQADPQPYFSATMAGAGLPEVLCHDICAGQTIFDHDNCLSAWKEQLAAYPQPFRAQLLGEVMLEARYRLKDMRRGCELSDLPLLDMSLSQLSLCLLRMVYAINEQYFPGLKYAMAGMAGMSQVPAVFTSNLERLLAAGRDPQSLARMVDQARRLTVDLALQALAIEGDVREAVLDPGLAEWPDLEPFSLSPQVP